MRTKSMFYLKKGLHLKFYCDFVTFRGSWICKTVRSWESILPSFEPWYCGWTDEHPGPGYSFGDVRTWSQKSLIFSVWKNPRPPCSLVQEPCLLSQFKKMFWAAVQCAEPGSSPVLCCAPLPLTVYVKPSIKVGYLHYIFFSDGNVVKCSNADFINLV